ncbi:uncharacterized protein LOC123676103 [Harmonia axyridis]|uniref:uncharacterized protein LOC123676103 n=1 Tax=Harmonia axyridis TaxID=115357 RepID=UPI001E275494|nr:uncharacterized protein LOC123676103 [Harmonia axyridis]
MEIRYCFLFYITSSIIFSVLTADIVEEKVPEDHELMQNIVQFIVDHKMINLFHRFGSRVVVLDGKMKATMMFEILIKHLPVPTVILKKNDEIINLNRMIAPSIAFILLEEEKKVKHAIEHLQNSKMHQTNTPTVLVKLSKVGVYEQFDVLSIMRTAWSLGLVRFLFIYYETSIIALSYNPFKGSLVDVSNKTGNDMFPRHLNNLHKYLWKVSLYEEWPLLWKKPGSQTWIGRDFTALKNVARIMNASFAVVEPRRKTGYQGAVRDLQEKKVDFCFVRRFKEEKIKGFRFVDTGSLSSLNVIVGKPALEELPTSVISVFSKEVWLYLAISMVAVITIMRLLAKNEKHYCVLNTILDIWRVLLNQSLPKSVWPKYTTKIVLTAWIWSSLILTSSFQSRFIHLMKYPHMKIGFQSLKELEKSNIPIYSSFNYVKMQGDRGYLQHQMNLVEYEDIIRRLDNPHSNSAVVLPFVIVRGKTTAEFLRYLDSRNKEILKESLVRGYAVYTFPSFSPFYSAIYLAILKQAEYGLAYKVPKSLKHGQTHKKAIKTSFSLNMKHVLTTFYVLGVGLIVSLLLFILEIIIGSNGIKS